MSDERSREAGPNEPLLVRDLMNSVEMVEHHSLLVRKKQVGTAIDLNSLGTAAGSEFRPMTAEGKIQPV